jgi:hypothetical protein
LLKTEKDESANNLATPKLTAYNGNKKVLTNIIK